MDNIKIRIKWLIGMAIANLFFANAISQSLDDSTANGSDHNLIEVVQEPLLVKWSSGDFNITGKGDNPQWNKTEWTSLIKLDTGGSDYKSKFKVLASEKGIYILFQGEDDKITTSDYKDMDKIWNGDVFEVFFQTDTKETKYFEYEVNQFEKQLLLTISNSKDGVSWIPFNEYDRNTYGTINKVEILGGPQELDAKIASWSAEVFISYKSLGLLSQVPPKSGTLWNANFYRSDYDTGSEVRWSWSSTIEQSFHDLDKFLPIKFE
tara:strand:- start:135 stop:926 length:792 start_codon:yes stop_codon:yes gene_type:complete